MPTDLAITVIGPDRNGIVSELSQLIALHEANWLDSHMAILAGQFAGIIHVSAPQNAVDDLKTALLGLKNKQLHITIEKGSKTKVETDSRQIQLQLTGLDHSGIVRDITQALFNINVSVAEFESAQYEGSMSGEAMFRAKARLNVPANVSMETLDEAMQSVSSSLMADIALADA